MIEETYLQLLEIGSVFLAVSASMFILALPFVVIAVSVEAMSRE